MLVSPIKIIYGKGESTEHVSMRRPKVLENSARSQFRSKQEAYETSNSWAPSVEPHVINTDQLERQAAPTQIANHGFLPDHCPQHLDPLGLTRQQCPRHEHDHGGGENEK